MSAAHVETAPAATAEAATSEPRAAKGGSATKTPSVARDLWSMCKPGIVRMAVITTAGGLWLAPATEDAAKTPALIIAALLGSALAVCSANVFNMVLERESDQLMPRTKRRPVAAGRISVGTAVRFASLLGVLSLAVLGLWVNLLTAGLAAFAIFSYVLIYTPLKFRTPAALVVGAVPGAVPPLLGWTAVRDQVDVAGLVLFGILTVWQIPHFIAIALYRKEEYRRAGIKVITAERGDLLAKLHASLWAVALIPISMALTPLGVAGPGYFVAAFVLGLAYFVYGLTGLRAGADNRWARKYFFASLIYLPALTLALVLDVLL